MERFRIVHSFPVRGQSRSVRLADDRVLGRQVILKSDRDAGAIEAEARALARIKSCHVVACYDVFRTGGGATSVIEYFCQHTLSDVLQRQGDKLSVDKTMTVADGLLRALQDMNAAGVIHRDLHPGHISYADRYRLKLFDLELALHAGSGGRVANPHPNGTWETMAPEEFEVGAEIGPATNVYSAACLIFRLLAGHYPLDYRRLTRDWRSLSTDGEKRRQYELHRTSPPDLSPLPRQLRTVFGKALAKRPGDRYAGAADFAASLTKAV